MIVVALYNFFSLFTSIVRTCSGLNGGLAVWAVRGLAEVSGWILEDLTWLG